MTKRPRLKEKIFSTDPSRFPIKFVLDKNIYFASYDWKKFFKIHQQFNVEEISSREFVNKAEQKIEYAMFKNVFPQAANYYTFIVARITIDKHLPLVNPLVNNGSFGNVVFQKPPVNKKQLDYRGYMISLRPKVLGNWHWFDLELYRMLKRGLDKLGLGWFIRKGYHHEWKKEIAIFELSYRSSFIGLWFFAEMFYRNPDGRPLGPEEMQLVGPQEMKPNDVSNLVV